jgi:hypothetical protein
LGRVSTMNDDQKALAVEVVDTLAAGYAIEPEQLALAEQALSFVAPAAVLKVVRKARAGNAPSNTEIRKARAAL